MDFIQAIINANLRSSLNKLECAKFTRLLIINHANPSWYHQVIDFVNEHKSFNKLLPIVAFDEYPTGFNKNPQEEEKRDKDDYTAARNIFETILHGLAYAFSDIDYGYEQYLLMILFFRNINDLRDITGLPEDTDPEKVHIYLRLIEMMIENNITMDELSYTPEHMELIESVPGMTESTITLLHLLYGETTSDKCLPYNDKQFKRGMSMFYKLEDPTKEKLKEITDTWTNKKVGLMFIVQYAHYSEYLEQNDCNVEVESTSVFNPMNL
jgi:hypothetical protein